MKFSVEMGWLTTRTPVLKPVALNFPQFPPFFIFFPGWIHDSHKAYKLTKSTRLRFLDDWVILRSPLFHIPRKNMKKGDLISV